MKITVEQATAEGWYRPNTNGGYCMCGCGQRVPVSSKTSREDGWLKGAWKRFIRGHNARTPEQRVKMADLGRTPEARARAVERGRLTPKGSASPWWKGTPEERFAQWVGELDEDGCIPWMGYTGPYGHGWFGINKRKSVPAHRFAWELERGPIPEGHHLHHLCGNPGCIRVEHLEPMTPSEHSRLHVSQ